MIHIPYPPEETQESAQETTMTNFQNTYPGITTEEGSSMIHIRGFGTASGPISVRILTGYEPHDHHLDPRRPGLLLSRRPLASPGAERD